MRVPFFRSMVGVPSKLRAMPSISRIPIDPTRAFAARRVTAGGDAGVVALSFALESQSRV